MAGYPITSGCPSSPYRNAIAPGSSENVASRFEQAFALHVGPPSGVMAFMTMIIITQRRMKFWALLQDRAACGLAALMVGTLMWRQATHFSSPLAPAIGPFIRALISLSSVSIPMGKGGTAAVTRPALKHGAEWHRFPFLGRIPSLV